MTVRVRDVCAALDEIAPPSLAFDWDRCGLSIGDPEWEVKGVLVALTVTLEAVAAARTAGAGMIVSHHPVIWESLQNLRVDNPQTRMCLDLVQAGIACFAAHTNLDIAPGGVNDVLADVLGLVDRQPLLPAPNSGMVKVVTFVPESHLATVREAVCLAGAGVIGDYVHCTFSVPGVGTFLPGEDAHPFSGDKGRVNEEPECRLETLVSNARLPRVLEAMVRAHPYEEPAYDLIPLENRDPKVGLGVRGAIEPETTLGDFARRVRDCLNLSYVRFVGDSEGRVRNVAVLAGSGGSSVGDIPQDIDVLVTGDVGYHDGLAARQRGLALIDAGHAGTEKCIVPALAQFLQKRFESLPVSMYDEPDVFRTVAQ